MTPKQDTLFLATRDYDSFELGLLALTRHFLTSFQTPQSQAWQRAYTVAAERWGPDTGLWIAHQMLKILRTASDARPGPIEFHNPLCPEERARLTADEAALIDMLHHMRRDDAGRARIAMDHLTAGYRDPYLVQSSLALAQRHPSGAKRPARQPECAPALRVVG